MTKSARKTSETAFERCELFLLHRILGFERKNRRLPPPPPPPHTHHPQKNQNRRRGKKRVPSTGFNLKLNNTRGSISKWQSRSGRRRQSQTATEQPQRRRRHSRKTRRHRPRPRPLLPLPLPPPLHHLFLPLPLPPRSSSTTWETQPGQHRPARGELKGERKRAFF